MCFAMFRMRHEGGHSLDPTSKPLSLPSHLLPSPPHGLAGRSRTCLARGAIHIRGVGAGLGPRYHQ